MNKKVLIDKMINDIAINLNTCDLEAAKNSYYAVFKAIVKNLKGHGIVYLPDFGRIKVSKTAPKITTPINKSSGRISVPGVKVVKFAPDEKLKEYIKKDGP